MDTDLLAPKLASRERSWTPRTELMVARIAIADDDPECLELLSELLRTPTTEICKATSGAELVLLLADHGPFDLIVTDIAMPFMEGLSVVGLARAAEIQAPVLFTTGLTRPDIEAAVARLGNAKLLRKPIAVSDLRAAVLDLLSGIS